jgi:hypothetical protein
MEVKRRLAIARTAMMQAFRNILSGGDLTMVVEIGVL